MIDVLQNFFYELWMIVYFFAVVAFEFFWRAVLALIVIYSLSHGLGKILDGSRKWLNEEVTIGKKREPKD